jgi:hypothetical protein
MRWWAGSQRAAVGTVVWRSRPPGPEPLPITGPRCSVLSEAIRAAIMSALEYPPEKKFQRFVALDESDPI